MQEEDFTSVSRRGFIATSAIAAMSVAALISAEGATALAPRNATPEVPAPGVHPRVFVKAEDVARIRAKLSDPVVAPRWSLLQTSAAFATDGKVPDGLFNADVKSAIEANAFLYLLNGDLGVGRKAVDQLLNFLDTFVPFNSATSPVGDFRNTGKVLVCAAMVYDWVYPQITPAERAKIIDKMKFLAGNQEVGYPPAKLSSIVSHGGEYELMRDQLAAGIAVYDEDREIFDLASARFKNEYVPARNFLYDGGRHSEGDSYQAVRFEPELLSESLYRSFGGRAGFKKSQGDIVTSWIYQRRPDGQMMRSGDSFQGTYTRAGAYWADAYQVQATLLSATLYRNEFHQGFLRKYLEKGYTPPADAVIWWLLFFDPTLGSRPASELPLTAMYNSPMAGMIARTGWDEGASSNAVIAQVDMGGYTLNNHQHRDAGAFQIYYRGALAIDSGWYEGANGGYGSAHDTNYHKRTIAHNALTIKDPAESFKFYGKPLANDGGQRWPEESREPRNLSEVLDPSKGFKTSTVLEQWLGPDKARPDFSHIKGDLTEAYSRKVSRVTRSAVFINLGQGDHPAALLIRDSITAADPSFVTSFLLHSIEQPQIAGNDVDVRRTENGNSGRLRMTTLLPASAKLTAVGGPDHEFEVDGINYPNSPKLPGKSAEPGAWRIEVSPSAQSEQTDFLHVLQVLPNSGVEPLTVTKTALNTNALAIAIADSLVIVSATSADVQDGTEFEVPSGATRTNVLITDLAPQKWALDRVGRGGKTQGTVSEGKGRSLNAKLAAGRYRLRARKR